MDNCRFIVGDAAEKLKELPLDSIDLTVTSPPYDNLRTYNGYGFDFETIARELYRVTTKGGVVVWVVGDQTRNGTESGTSFRQALFFKSLGFNLHDTMIYASEKPPLTHNRYEQKFEYMFVFSKGKPKTFHPIMEACKYAGGSSIGTIRQTAEGTLEKAHAPGKIKDFKIRGNIWSYRTGPSSSNDKEAFEHPAIFPEQLVEDHINSWSNPGDTVLDPMLGSGTTGKMAIKLSRKFVGIELSPEYMELAKARIARYAAVETPEAIADFLNEPTDPPSLDQSQPEPTVE